MNVLTIDIGGTAIKYARMNEDMNMSDKGKVPTPQTSRAELLDALAKLHAEFGDTEGIAISMPGIIDTQKGYCIMGGALRYNDDFYLRHALYEKCPVKITIENDAKCAALAEATVGALADVEDGFVLIFGTMIGGGYIKNHKVHRGPHFSAGEVSYITSDRNGKPTFDGVWGNRCGTPQLCRMYAQAKHLPESEVDGVVVFNAVNAGDEIAKQCLERFAEEELYSVCPYYVPHAEIVTCKFQNDANLIGALQSYIAEHA